MVECCNRGGSAKHRSGRGQQRKWLVKSVLTAGAVLGLVICGWEKSGAATMVGWEPCSGGHGATVHWTHYLVMACHSFCSSKKQDTAPPKQKLVVRLAGGTDTATASPRLVRGPTASKRRNA